MNVFNTILSCKLLEFSLRKPDPLSDTNCSTVANNEQILIMVLTAEVMVHYFNIYPFGMSVYDY